MPLQRPGVRIQRQDAIREEVIAASLAVVGIRKRIACRRVERIVFRIITPREPCRAASIGGVSPFPGVVARFALRGNGPVPPDPLSR